MSSSIYTVSAKDHEEVAFSEVIEVGVHSEDENADKRIDNHNVKDFKVDLLDISYNKDYIAYVTTENKMGGNNRSYLTRRRFSEAHDTPLEAAKKNYTVNITKYLKDPQGVYCRFLSISPDGKFIAISYLERNVKAGTSNGYRRPENQHCFIFVVGKQSITLRKKITFQGRAVFVGGSADYSLALLGTETLNIYSGFASLIIKNPTYRYDLRPFASSSDTFTEAMYSQKSFVNNSPWVQIHSSENSGTVTPNGMPTLSNLQINHNEKNEALTRIITMSRHLRNNLLVTPFDIGGVVRAWSTVEDGARLLSFAIKPKVEHIVAFSKNNDYTATFMDDESRSVNIYSIKSGLLFKLESRRSNCSAKFRVTHVRFCYGGRYLAMAGIETKFTEDGEFESSSAVYEIWYIYTEKSIYLKEIPINDIDNSPDAGSKTVQPYVSRYNKEAGGGKKLKCLKGVYTTYDKVNRTTMTLFEDLDIDESNESSTSNKEYEIRLDWIETTDPPSSYGEYEVNNNLGDYNHLKCAKFSVTDSSTRNENTYLLRFGAHTVQLWKLDAKISENNQLLYIRAYKGPTYGLAYSFREPWRVFDFEHIKLVGTSTCKRVLVNIVQGDSFSKSLTNNKDCYYTEELFLPFSELKTPASIFNFDPHNFESACQALHYLQGHATERYKGDGENQNLTQLIENTENIIKTSIETAGNFARYFQTNIGSETLAMLSSFEKGIHFLKEIIKKEGLCLNIFSYPRSRSELRELQSHQEFFGDDDEENENTTTDQGAPENTIHYLSKYRSSPPIKFKLDYKKTFGSSIARNENFLTILIDKREYDLYNYMFNIILESCKELGLGCLPALTDTLLYLQDIGKMNFVNESLRKLSYLSIDKIKMGIRDTELPENTSSVYRTEKEIYNFETFEPLAISEQLESYSSTLEQIKKYSPKNCGEVIGKFLEEHVGPLHSLWKNHLLPSLKRFWRRQIVVFWNTTFTRSANRSKMWLRKYGKFEVCVVPLPFFNTYGSFLDDESNLYNSTDVSKSKSKTDSAFVRVASFQHKDNMFLQGYTILEVFLVYKWRKFARIRFALICMIHTIYYITYSTAVLFPQEMYGFVPGVSSFADNNGHLAAIILMSLSGFILLFQELHQCIKSRSKVAYFLSGFNWVDILALVFPLVTTLQLVYNWDYLYEINSVSTLILWMHGFLRLRIARSIGFTIETILKMFKEVFPVLCILLLVVVAFTNSYMVLLRLNEDEFFQESYEGAINTTTTSGINEGVISILDVSASNAFNDPYKSFSQVWFFLFGLWDPITGGDAGDSKMIVFISMLFTFVTVLIFFNLVIALMSGIVDDVKQSTRKAWAGHFADVVLEVEQLWCSPQTAYNKVNNPNYIYYVANVETIAQHRETLKIESKKLRKKLYPELEITRNA